MRGTLHHAINPPARVGIIPAYAGNTDCGDAFMLPVWDHPRVCGEHPVTTPDSDTAAGSSPRMRGTHFPTMPARLPVGIIPAYAGNTIIFFVVSFHLEDHPRVCGEHTRGARSTRRCRGSSPRMRGTLRDYSNFVVSKFMSFVFHLV